MKPSFLTHLAIIFWIPKAILSKCIDDSCSVQVLGGGGGGGMQSHIVNGANTTIERFPHCVFLHVGASYCGGSVVSQSVVITAAHCVDHDEGTASGQPPHIEAFAGLSHKKEFNANAMSRVEYCLKNENWRYKFNGDLYGDIALLFLKDSLPLNKHIKRVIISPVYPAHVRRGHVAGWGRTTPLKTRRRSHGLKVTQQTIRPAAECRAFMRESEVVRDLHGVLCAGTEDDPGLPSTGDSGSGLITAKHQALGVVSFSGITANHVVYYTNVSYYFPWIKKSIVQFYCNVKTRRTMREKK